GGILERIEALDQSVPDPVGDDHDRDRGVLSGGTIVGSRQEVMADVLPVRVAGGLGLEEASFPEKVEGLPELSKGVGGGTVGGGRGGGGDWDAAGVRRRSSRRRVCFVRSVRFRGEKDERLTGGRVSGMHRERAGVSHARRGKIPGGGG